MGFPLLPNRENQNSQVWRKDSVHGTPHAQDPIETMSILIVCTVYTALEADFTGPGETLTPQDSHPQESSECPRNITAPPLQVPSLLHKSWTREAQSMGNPAAHAHLLKTVLSLKQMLILKLEATAFLPTRKAANCSLLNTTTSVGGRTYADIRLYEK